MYIYVVYIYIYIYIPIVDPGAPSPWLKAGAVE